VKFQKSKKAQKIIANVNFTDAAAGVTIHASKISNLTFDGNEAHFTGTGKQGRKPVSFTVDAIDNGTPGTFDSFSIHLSTGYSASGTLTSGDIHIQ
jgi:hypothetical protein